MDHCCCMYVISALLLLVTWTPAGYAESMCVDTCPSNSISNISVTVLSDTMANVSWSPSFEGSNSMATEFMYVLQYKTQIETQFDQDNDIRLNDTSFSLTNLLTGTGYEVQVCLDGEPSNCGGCLKCFTTIPGPPTIALSSEDPRSFTVVLNLPNSATLINVFYGTEMNNLTMKLETDLGTVIVVTDNVIAGTEYFVAVSYDSEIGSSPLSETSSVTVRSFNDDPGIMLSAYGTRIGQYPVAVETDVPQTSVNDFIDSGSFNIRDIDYDYSHNYVYVTTNDNSIARFAYTSDAQFSSLTVNGSAQILYSNLGDVQSITVDWIGERLYWFEFQSGSTQIYSAPYNGESSDIKAHGLPIQGFLDSFTVDPIHGYFYWTQRGSKLVRINYSYLVTATPSTDITSLETALARGSQISSFTLDLADLVYFYIKNNDTRSVRIQLSGNEALIGQEVDGNPVLKTSFGNRLVLIVNNVIFFRQSDYSSTGSFFSLSGLTDVRMLRSSYQPSPSPPSSVTNIKVLANNVSAHISWNEPIFASEIFGSDAFNDWEYSINFRPRDSDEIQTVETAITSATLSNLTPGVTYIFDIITRGPSAENSVTTPYSYVFTTFGSDEQPRLLVTTNQGVLGVDTQGSDVGYLSETRVDASSASASNPYFDPVRYFISDDGGDFFIQSGDSAPVESALVNRNRPMYIQLDWIARKIYWVEEQRKVINRISTLSNDLSDSFEQFETSSEPIAGMALDSLNGVVFWLTSSVGIKGRGLSGFVPAWTCLSMSDPRAIALDSANNRLFVAYFTDSTLTIATLNYTTFSCDSSSLESREISNLQFNSAKNISLAYGANTLYLAQESQFTVYSLSAEFSSVNSSHHLALGSIDVTPTEDIPSELRALSVVLKGNRPLPESLPEDMYFDVSGNMALLTPPSPGLPVLNADTSTTTFIDITWEPPPFTLSNVFYKVEATLTTAVNKTVSFVKTNVLSGNSLQLFNQSFSTQVDATITSYSVWYRGTESSNTFFSPAAKPEQVQNVRVNVFFPIRDQPTVVTAQIVWDGLTIRQAGGMISHYSIDVFNDAGQRITAENEFISAGMLYNGPPFIVSNISTEFTLTLSGIEGFIFYPLRPDRNYSVTVQANNSAGSGEPSEEVTFTTTGASPPREVVVVSPSGGYIVGEEDSDVMLPSISPPIALNNINRTLYYYTKTNNTFHRGSLDRNVESIVVTKLREDLEPLAFTFDWIAQTVYVIARSTQTLKLEVWTVFEPRGTAVFVTEIDNVLQRDINVSAIINPFRGYLSWTQASDTDSTEVYQLNLRDNSVSCLIGCQNKRSVDLSTLSVTGAFTLDPLTQEVWLCDSNTGDILVCNVSASALTRCTVAVNASSLGQSPNGLPADQLSIDENTIYWSRYSDPTVYYVERSDPTDLQSLDVLLGDNFIMVGVSPGQQPLPVSFTATEGGASFINNDPYYCLSPEYNKESFQPVPSLVSKTNTSVTLSWMTGSGLPSECDDVVFSVLPSSYLIEITNVMNMSDVMTRDNIYTTTTVINGLQSYTQYTFHISASNIYTTNKGTHGDDRTYRTTEGVPDDIDTLQVLVYGPRQVFVMWDPQESHQLRGNLALRSFTLYLNANLIGTDLTTISNDFTSLNPDTNYTFGVAVSNGVLTSPTAVITTQTFSRPPSAVATALEPRAFNITVTLTEEHANITEFTVEVNDIEIASEIASNQFYPQSFQYTYSDGVTPFTEYSVVVKGTYASFNVSNRLFGPVSETSVPTVVRTNSTVPSTPNIRLVDDREIQWDEINNNGAEITMYILSISYIEDGENRSDVQTSSYDSDTRSIRIDTLTPIQDTLYFFSLQAINGNGESNSSNEVSHETSARPIDSFTLNEALMYIVAPVGSLLVLIFILLLVICCCCLCATPDKRATFRPDYELIRLREDYAKSRQHAFNPNYMWTRDDYTTYQDDLDNINKFPRNKLRLENFIDRGEFGEVYQGTAIDILAADSGPTPVAVKTMRKGATQDEKEKFLSEAALMSNFNHQNIVKVLGVCLDNDPIFIIMELMPAGDLLKFLREARQESGPPLLTLAEQIQIAIDVGQGCRYLEQQHFIHRDIAGRNCLVTSKGADRVVKIGDFGLAKDLYTSDYYQVEGQRKLPVRWMAPEALLQGKFTIETDIWSYGVLLWEIFTFGNQPYPGRNNQEVLQFVTGGGRLEKPENCSIRVYKLMQACWETPSERLHFAQIVEYLAHYLEHVNNKRDSYFSDDDEEGGDGDEELSRKNSKPSRTSSVRSVGLINLARQGSVRIRRSIRVRASLKKDDMEANNQNHTGLNSEENLVDDGAFRERGPF